MKKLLSLLLCLMLLCGCKSKPSTISLAAAASLENAFAEIIPLYEKEHNVKIEGTYDSSGKLQAQIESGMQADLFFSAATKQMNSLVEGGYILEEDVVSLLNNKLVLIKRKDVESQVTCFGDLEKASMIALGDEASVPAGKYASEVIQYYNLNLDGKVSYASNVTEVLNWVNEKSCEVGVVYLSDAISLDTIEILDEANVELQTPIIYPVATLKDASDEAKEFLDYLQSEEAIKIFEKYGLAGAQNS